MAIPSSHHTLAAFLRRYRHALLATAYCLLIVYGSLYPFADWRLPAGNALAFFLEVWPPYVTRTDVMTNLLAYLPLGYLLARATREKLHPVLYGVLLSMAMELLQTLLPGRVSSNFDVLTNGAGSLSGVALAWYVERSFWPCKTLAAWRHRWFLPGRLVGGGLLLLGLWALSQLSLQLPSLVAGNLRSSFAPFWETLAAPSHFKEVEALIYLLEITGLSLFAATLLRAELRRGFFLIVLFLAAVLFKLLAAALLVKFALLPRLISLEALVGFGAGVLLLVFFQRSRPGAPYGTAMVMLGMFAVAKAAYWFADMATGKVFMGGGLAPERLFNITGLAYAISEVWPFLAIGHLLVRRYFMFVQKRPPS